MFIRNTGANIFTSIQLHSFEIRYIRINISFVGKKKEIKHE